MPEAAALLNQTLQEEMKAERLLTQIAKSKADKTAAKKQPSGKDRAAPARPRAERAGAAVRMNGRSHQTSKGVWRSQLI